MADDLWKLAAHELAALTTSRQISAVEAISAHLSRMQAVNPALNAVVVDLSDQALARARALDAAGETPGPLHGLPATIKINIDQAGQATSNGLVALKDTVAPDDAPIVRNLQNAGAVVIGRTNTPEFSFRAETDNPLFGMTHNPWGRHVSAGGSSGGAGASVMAGVGVLAHGNDIGGSLRFPAAANGAVTLKSGLGRVPAWNPSQSAERGLLAQSMSVQGLLVRSARDLALAMPAVIAPDPRDPFHVPLPWDGPAVTGPLRVGITRETYGFDLHPEVDAALDAAAAALRDAGYVVENIVAPAMPQAAQMGYRAIITETQLMLGPDIYNAGSDTIRAVFDEYFRQFPPFEPPGLLQAMAQRSGFARDWALFQQETPLVLTPFLPQPFFRPNRDLEGADGVREVLGAALWSYAVNFLGLPAGVMPTRLSHLPQGVQPTSVQLIGPRWREDLVVQAMIAIEDRIGPMAPRLWARMA